MDAPGEKLLIKLVEALQSGLGVATKAWLTRRQARAEALGKAEAVRIERLNQELLRQQLRDIRAGRKNIDSELRVLEAKPDGGESGAVVAKLKDDYLTTLRSSGTSPAALIELERRINLDQISGMVLEDAAADAAAGAADDRPVDPDWFAQWRNRAQDVSNEDMQRLWAKLLKEEGKKVASFSIHTMDFLSRMSRDDAELIAKLGNFAFDRRYLFGGESKALNSGGFNLEMLLYLDDLGIISGVTGLNTISSSLPFQEMRPGKTSAVIRCNDKALVFTPKPADRKTVAISMYPISIVGRELLQLASCNADTQYLKEVAESVRDQCEMISIADVVANEGTQFQARITGTI